LIQKERIKGTLPFDSKIKGIKGDATLSKGIKGDATLLDLRGMVKEELKELKGTLPFDSSPLTPSLSHRGRGGQPAF
jgi:hypothetical protein